MAINPMLVPERSRSIGEFMVGRLLPFRKKRQVGPFTFIDHMGPVNIKAKDRIDVDQHPHIGLCTLTYLLEGSMQHQDSTGAKQVIHAGDVGLMTSGSGVTHSERRPEALHDKDYVMHGYQIWIALPKEKEEMQARFDYLSADQLPSTHKNGLNIKMVAGNGFGLSSPLPVHSELFMADVYAEKNSALNFKEDLQGEIAIVVVSGSVVSENESIGPGNMLIHENAELCSFEVQANSRLLLFGGPELKEERHLLWNFVSTSKVRLKQAADDWKAKRFPKIEGDDTYVPFPDMINY